MGRWRKIMTLVGDEDQDLSLSVCLSQWHVCKGRKRENVKGGTQLSHKNWRNKNQWKLLGRQLPEITVHHASLPIFVSQLQQQISHAFPMAKPIQDFSYATLMLVSEYIYQHLLILGGFFIYLREPFLLGPRLGTTSNIMCIIQFIGQETNPTCNV